VSELFTLFEHETRPFDLTPRQLSLLDQLQERLPEKILQPVYRAGRWSLRAGQHVGVVRLGALSIQILPKIYAAPDTAAPATRAREATANLLHMLAYAGLVRIQESAIVDLLSRESDWFEILTHLFASHLAEEWRRGPIRAYQTVEDDLPLLKGKWRLAAQIRRPDKRHRFVVTYDEFTVDVPLNRVFRYVVERLSRLTRSADNASLLGDLRASLDGVSLVPMVHMSDVDRIIFSRLNARYAPVLNLARLFLDRSALQTASGEDTR
jgi:5-methylcytosine-specific restriction enzyme subunit McrC